jgi:DegV family protein with EDD domain
MKKRQFTIVTDSACDMPKEYYTEHDVVCVPLGFMLNNINYEGESGNAMDPKEFYAQLRGGAMPTTYQVTAEQAKLYIEPLLQKGEDVLIVTFSSGLSGTSGSFSIAARDLKEEYPDRKIFVVDSLCASMGQGLFLDYILKKADADISIEDMAEYAEGLKMHICHQFTVDDLFHLKRGGRVSSTAAVLGSMLNVKPILHVSNEGKLTSTGKVMGRKKALQQLVENMVELADIAPEDPIYISHADCIDDVEVLKEMVKKCFPENKIVVEYIGPVIGCHSGCGTIALFFKAKRRTDK